MTARQHASWLAMRKALRAYERYYEHCCRCAPYGDGGDCCITVGYLWDEAQKLRREALPERRWRDSELDLYRED